MKTNIIASLALALTSPLFAGGEGWMTDFEAAKKKALEEKKDLLVDFTGSDWCGWCIKLKEEVFQHDPFKKGVADKFVLVELDYPRDQSKMSEATIAQNEKLKEQFQIQGYPTILLLDAEGRPFAKTGYQAGGPEKYVTHLDELRAKRKVRDEAFASAEKLEGVAKAKALVKALGTIPENYVSHYGNLTEQIAQLDPKDETGFVAAQKLKEDKQGLEQKVMASFQAGKFDEALTTIDKFITDHSLKGEDKQEALSMKIGAFLQQQRFDDAEKLVDELVALAPESELAGMAKNFKPRLAQMKAAAEKKAAPEATETGEAKPEAGQ